jgi:hypothetical protein
MYCPLAASLGTFESSGRFRMSYVYVLVFCRASTVATTLPAAS